MKGYANPQLLIAPAELAAAGAAPQRIDTRAPERYAAGRLPGALYLDL